MVPPGPPRKKGWFRRNAAWFIPTLVVVVLGACGGCVFGIFQFAFGMIKGSDVYQDALGKARGNAAVVAELGEPVEERGFPTGNVSYSNADGDASLQIPIKGPKGQATIHVVATRSMGKWTYSTLTVVVEGSGKEIDLTEAEDAVAPSTGSMEIDP
jgi:hypothetical protein